MSDPVHPPIDPGDGPTRFASLAQIYADPGHRRRFIRWSFQRHAPAFPCLAYCVYAYRRRPTPARGRFIGEAFLAGAPLLPLALDPAVRERLAADAARALGGPPDAASRAFDAALALADMSFRTSVLDAYNAAVELDEEPAHGPLSACYRRLIRDAAAAGFTLDELGLDTSEP